jgi:hypothetical protein
VSTCACRRRSRREAYHLANDLEEIGYVSMNFLAGRPSEPNVVTRRRWAQQARVVWLADPMAGAAVEMLNEFTFGRGVARPRFKDKEAQEVVDEAWDDPQNQRVLTSSSRRSSSATRCRCRATCS